ncbi:MAG: hypothetical protein M0P64_04180 [Candidatus Pacebacteria bacterium]|jgi:predicted NAD-dependent protein-ADP-ribosyltransferase YbiA (DUF1768 family)|nr:hypothetical protein [Candidatus Paceibacterota bacterium]
MPKLNVSARSNDWRAKALSNFTYFPFTLDGEVLASAEGFIQGIKFPPKHQMREIAFLSAGKYAKDFGAEAERKFVWWENQVIPYGTPAHHRLIERAIRAKFEQNADAMNALLSTAGMQITHDIGAPESPTTSLPAVVFCDILIRIREEALKIERPAPLFIAGHYYRLKEKPNGCESQHLPLAIGKYYKFLEWSGSNVMIETGVKGETASIHYSRLEPHDSEA